MENEKTTKQMSDEIFASIEQISDSFDWYNEGFHSVQSNNGFPYRVFFKKEDCKAVLMISDDDFVFKKSNYMIYADSERDAGMKAAILLGTLQVMFWLNRSRERFDLLDVLQPSIRRWEESLDERPSTSQAG